MSPPASQSSGAAIGEEAPLVPADTCLDRVALTEMLNHPSSPSAVCSYVLQEPVTSHM